jgi:hypothetical protein
LYTVNATGTISDATINRRRTMEAEFPSEKDRYRRPMIKREVMPATNPIVR